MSAIPADTEVKTTASGLKYSILSPGGGGKSPKRGDKVTVHYRGWLADGTQFDSSHQRNKPAEFILGRVIDGWTEGAQLMTKGARFKFTIPPELGYKERGYPPVIPANATLTFEVELLDFVSFPDFRPARAEQTVTTKSGLKYEILAEGSGDAPKEDERLEFRYALWTKDSRALECSQLTGQSPKGTPAELKGNMAFLGEGLLLMKPGARFRFEVPPEQCFGAEPRGPDLPGNSVTIWEIELVRVFRPLPLPAFVKTPEDKLKKTASGLMYEVLKDGAGDSPKPGESVTVNYAGWLTSGTLFDSSFAQGEPTTFSLGQVIPGWTEGLQLMKPGAVYRFTIPPALAYGAQGYPPKIGGNETLIFQIELVKVGPP